MTYSSRPVVVLLLISLLLTTVIYPVAADTAADTAVDTAAVVFTEICFNPAFEENDYGLETSADVFEYVEVCNISDAPVSLAGMTLARSTEGYEGTFLTSTVLPPDGADALLAPGAIAVIAIPTGDGYTAGLRTATEADRTAYYERFTRFYGCADRLPREHFYILDNRDNATGDAYDYGFNLANTHEDVVLRLVAGDNKLCEVNFSAATWNRNGYALNLTYRAGGVDGHPTASVPYNLGAYTPGLVRDNQVSTTGLTPTGDTLSLRAMQYNVCATDSTQLDTDGTTITMDERIGHTLDVIEGYEPDILALCEINYLWASELKSTLTGEDGAYTAYGRSSKGSSYDSKRINRETWDLFNLILWKTEKYELVREGTFWCSSTPDQAGTFSWSDGLVGDFARGINWVILRDRESGGEFFVLCAHIDAKVAEARLRSATLITDMATLLADGRPILMFGDWNANERSSAYRELTSDGFADARYRVPTPEHMTIYGTTNGWGSYDDFLSRTPIDHCIITPQNVFVESATMDPGYFDEADTLVSADHNATIFELRLTVHRDPADTEAPTEPVTEPVTDAATTTPSGEETPPVGTDTEPSASDEPAFPFPFIIVGILLVLAASATIVIVLRHRSSVIGRRKAS